MAIKDWIIISISFITLLTVFYKDFLKGSDLKTVLSTIVFVKAAENNRGVILEQIIINDLLSANPSQQALGFIQNSAELANSVKNRNRDQVRVSLGRLAKSKAEVGSKLIYDVSENALQPYFGDKNIALSFYVPLNITNIGRKTGDLTSLMLYIESLENKDQKWVFSCFAEIRAEDFMKIVPNQPMGTIIGKLFSGISIGPSSNFRLDAHLIPMDIVKNKIISRISLMPGKYNVQIIGFNSSNKQCLLSNVSTISIDSKMLTDVFNGSNIAINLSAEDNISNFIK